MTDIALALGGLGAALLGHVYWRKSKGQTGDGWCLIGGLLLICLLVRSCS